MKKSLDVFQKHQLSIARKTLNMTSAMAMIMGGMSLEEAKIIVKKLS